MYEKRWGNPGIDPVSLIKIVMKQYIYGIPSMRQTIREIEVNTAYRWFIGYDIDGPVPHFSTFGKNYSRRFPGTDIFERIFRHKSHLHRRNPYQGKRQQEEKPKD